MIRFLTAHYRTDRWVTPQLSGIARNIDEPYEVWSDCEGLDGHLFDRTFSFGGPRGQDGHQHKLNSLAAAALEESEPDDLLVFLDSDSWPIQNPLPLVRSHLSAGSTLVAVQRPENMGEPQPHPSFCAVTADRWDEIGGDWSRGYYWRNSAGDRWSDTGAMLLPALKGRKWTPLLRTNRINLHPVFFGVYGGVVYHHGAGSRDPMCRRDRYEAKGTAARARSAANAALSEAVYERLAIDPEFWRELV